MQAEVSFRKLRRNRSATPLSARAKKILNGCSCGVVMIRIFRIPASIRDDKG